MKRWNLKKKNGRLKALLLTAVLSLSVMTTGCLDDIEDYDDDGGSSFWDDDDDEKKQEAGVGNHSNNAEVTGTANDGSWAIYIYMCASDLESGDGSATEDISEMMEAELSDDVTIVIEGGGTESWQNDYMDSDYLNRLVITKDSGEVVDQRPLANMGDANTLAEFLSWAGSNYPADNTMVVFWNHGGGSTGGVCYDEVYNYDSLTLSEMKEAFDDVYDLSAGNPPFEIVGFDTCLMATIDTADAMHTVAKYMVASEETEPGYGWHYTPWLQTLSDNPAISSAELGKAICDSFMEFYEYYDMSDEVTLSVTDLSKVPKLVECYDALGQEALAAAANNTSFFSSFGNNASKSENYGGNTKDEGYTNMVDLKDLVSRSSDLLPQNANNVLSALDDCVIYKVNGDYRANGGGLSCYYSYNGDTDDLNALGKEGSSNSFYYLYEYQIKGSLNSDGETYYNDMIENLSASNTSNYEYADFDDIEEACGLDENMELIPEAGDDGYSTLTLSDDIMNEMTGIYNNMAYIDEENNELVFLGVDNDINADWDAGEFKDNFMGYWGGIDGHLCYMEITCEYDDYNLYNVPILLNGEEYQLHVVYDYDTASYSILGAKKGIDEDTGMSSKDLVKLKAGDQITTLLYTMSLDDDDDELYMVESETFTVTNSTSFDDVDMGDGLFALIFEIRDYKGTSVLSEAALFEVSDGEISTY